MRRFVLILLFLSGALSSAAQGIPRAADFSVVCDTLTARCNRRFEVRSKVRIDKIYLRGDALDLYFASRLADSPWHNEDIFWFLSELNTEGEKVLRGYKVGSCMTSGCRLEELETPKITNNGKSPSFHYQSKNVPRLPLVSRSGAR